MESKSHNRVPETSFIEKGSIHQLKGIKWLRVIAFSVIVVGLDFAALQSDSDFPHKTQHWLSEFIESNELNQPLFVKKESQENSTPKNGTLLAVSSNMEVNEAMEMKEKVQKVNHYSEKERPNPTTQKRVELTTLSLNSKPLTELKEKQLVFKNFNQIPVYDVVLESVESESLFDYQPNYVLDNGAFVKKWHAFLAIGPQFVNGDVTQPSAENYEKVSGINDIVSEAGGVTYSSSKASFSAHLGLGYDLSKNWSVNMALQYSQFNGAQISFYNSEVTQTQTILTTVAVSDENGIKGFETAEEIIEYTNHFSDTLTANYRLTQLEIPIAVQYKREWGKYYGFLRTGVSGVFNSNYSASYESKEIGSGVITQESWKLTSLNMNLGIGMGYKVHPDFSVQLYPQYTKLIPIQGAGSIQNVTRSIGVFGGVVYSFK